MLDAAKVQHCFQSLAFYRTELLKRFLWQSCGFTVQSGPFSGMRLLDRSAEGCYVPKLLGCYEAELHETFESLADGQYECVLNIGSGEGFYAVGLARMLPDVEVFAYESDAHSRAACQYLAELNGVRERVQIRGTFSAKDFSLFSNRRCFVLCDVEGAELDLLDPIKYPELQEFDVLAELHDFSSHEISRILPPRFAESHEFQLIEHGPRNPAQFPALRTLPQLDQWLAIWEFRAGPTPWAIFRAHVSRRPISAGLRAAAATR